MKLNERTTMGAVHLVIRQTDLMVDYYERVIGLELQEKSAERLTLGVADRPLLFLYPSPDAVVPSQPQPGLYHFALLLPTRRDLALTLRHLIDAGVPLGASDHIVSEALYLNDPEGNGIEIYADRPPERWQFDPQTGRLAMVTARLNGQNLLAEIQPGDGWQGLPAGTIMGHIHLRVADIQSAKSFFIDGLGFDFMQDYGGSASFVSKAGYHHHLGFNTWETAGAPPAADHLTGLKYFEIHPHDPLAAAQLASDLAQTGHPTSPHPAGWLVSGPSGIRLLLSNIAA